FQFSFYSSNITTATSTVLSLKLRKYLPNASPLSSSDNQKPKDEISTDKNKFLKFYVLNQICRQSLCSGIACRFSCSRHSVVSQDHTTALQPRIFVLTSFILINYIPLKKIWKKSYFI
uniref:Uncharacterized protein n=1 Tax=Pongo abelii TaxID=9601 RepID=A0A8I5U0M9_PONAB